ncbi:hypothetical protein M0802_014572 [Mischocyttarus mexicanus]|nr:hypothetical protein M0802_014572 [Mischocyttarus mexicanus]
MALIAPRNTTPVVRDKENTPAYDMQLSMQEKIVFKCFNVDIRTRILKKKTNNVNFVLCTELSKPFVFVAKQATTLFEISLS